MKKCLLFALTILGFTSATYAASEISCGDGPIGAALFIDSKWGTVASLRDNYDTAQRTAPKPNGRFGLQCKQVGSSIECAGVWAFEQRPAKVVFTTDGSGNISATFARSPYYGGKTVTIACVAREDQEN